MKVPCGWDGGEQWSPAVHLPPLPPRLTCWRGGSSAAGWLPVGGFLSVTAGNKGQVWGHIGESNC